MVAITAGRTSFAGFENDIKISFSESPIYYTALKMFKIYDTTAVDSNSDEDDEMDYSSEISGGEADW